MFFFPETFEGPSDYLQLIVATAIKGLPLLVFVLVMVRLARNREHRWLRAALTGEVGEEGIHADELTTLEDPSARRRARKEIKARAGPVAAATLKRLHRAQIDLAMIRTRVEEDDHPDLVRQRTYCAALRTWLDENAAPKAS